MTDPTECGDTSSAREVARDFAWKHFDLHAKQRIEVFKSYLTLITLIFAGYGVAFQTKNYGLGILLALFSLIVSFFFRQLDERTKALIKLSETYLKDEESNLARELQNKHIAIFAESDRLSEVQGPGISYGTIFSWFFLANGVFAVIMASLFVCSKLSSS